MKTLCGLVLLALATVGAAVEKEIETPAFADGWRVSGILKQGGKLQASMEHSAHMARFVVEGGELLPGARVETIDATARAVTVRKGNLVATIRPGSAPVMVKSRPVVAQTSPQSPSQPTTPQTPQPQMTAKAGQDASGRWGIQLSDGRFLSAQDYAARYGGTEQAIARLNSRLTGDVSPERKAFAQQMLTALQNAPPGQSQPIAAGGAVSPSGTAADVSISASVSPATVQQGAATPEEPVGFQDPSRVFRRGPQFRR
ncbi:MAG: hypothetical protein NT105_14160 [Verrucomicrobia bacterium]|nr:hypothetical protein [Verrucomicrobiota bacterium]